VLYRAACELLVNTLKHALASEVRLILDQKNGYLELFFSDNGVGFNPDEIKERGTGLANISTRIRSLNGQFELKSAVGKGMQVKIRVMAK
jgi:signal transduction histidine kinase